MIKYSDHINEQQAAAAFSKQSTVFDELYETNSIIRYKRERVRQHVLKYAVPGCHILELNAGTGDDALFFAQSGFFVHATDISEGMQQKLEQKIQAAQPGHRVSNELCSYTALETLNNKGPYDYIFSNFAGLNCTDKLEKVLCNFDDITFPGAMVTLVIMPKFCLWETLLFFKGEFKTAGRRFFSSKGRAAKAEGLEYRCWYHSPKRIRKILEGKFEHIETEGLCTLVPPSYMEQFAEKYPRLFSFLSKKEGRLKSAAPWKYIGDYYIITLKKR